MTLCKHMARFFGLAVMSIMFSAISSAASGKCTALPSGTYTVRSIGTNGVNNGTIASELQITLGQDNHVTGPGPSPVPASYPLHPSTGQITSIGKVEGVCKGNTLDLILSGDSILAPVKIAIVIRAKAKPDPSQTIKKWRYYFDIVNDNNDYHTSGWID